MKRSAWESFLLYVSTCVASFVLLWALLALLEGVLFWPVALGVMVLSLLVLNALCGVFLRQYETSPDCPEEETGEIVAPSQPHPAVRPAIFHRSPRPHIRVVQGGRVA